MTTSSAHAFRPHPGLRQGFSSEVPLPTRLVSNEEFAPLPPTAAQRRVEAHILAQAGRLAPRSCTTWARATIPVTPNARGAG